jgi:hypothetical protein
VCVRLYNDALHTVFSVEILVSILVWVGVTGLPAETTAMADLVCAALEDRPCRAFPSCFLLLLFNQCGHTSHIIHLLRFLICLRCLIHLGRQ